MRNPELDQQEIKKELLELRDELKNKQRERGGEEKRRKVAEQKAEEEDTNTESGYSETQQALDIEVRSGDLQSFKKSKSFLNLPQTAKTLSAYKIVSRQLSDLVEHYTALIEKDLHQAQKMLAEIARIRAMQKVLLTKLFGKLPDEIDDKEVLEELEEFIKE